MTPPTTKITWTDGELTIELQLSPEITNCVRFSDSSAKLLLTISSSQAQALAKMLLLKS